VVTSPSTAQCSASLIWRSGAVSPLLVSRSVATCLKRSSGPRALLDPGSCLPFSCSPFTRAIAT
ncbi:unnamed protein product, partial [Effrenium voratum]